MQYESTIRSPRTQDLTGQSFDRLTVLCLAGYRRQHAYWTCECICGATKDIAARHLLSRKIGSCTCLRREVTTLRKTIHGKSHTSEWIVWVGMIHRCEDPKHPDYARYGGRGITVYAPWHDFRVFYADMGPRPSPRHSIDRYPDNNGAYHPENCRWATTKEQSRNTRANRMLTLHGITQCLQDWALQTGMDHKTIGDRLDRGWSEERALLTPPRRNRRWHKE
jgi:hypothetical protein